LGGWGGRKRGCVWGKKIFCCLELLNPRQKSRMQELLHLVISIC